MAVQKVYKVVENPGTVVKWQVDDRTTTSQTAAMAKGEPLKAYADGSPYVTCLATEDPEMGTDTFVGITNSASTETAAANGEVDVITCVPMLTIMRAKATTAANFDTQAEIDALVGDQVGCDVTALTGTNGDFTIDENEGHDSNVHGFKILRGDPIMKTADFFVMSLVMFVNA